MFLLTGQEQVSISAYVYVNNVGATTTDVWSPNVRHDFQGSCIGRRGDDCASYVWSASIFARDAVSGIMFCYFYIDDIIILSSQCVIHCHLRRKAGTSDLVLVLENTVMIMKLLLLPSDLPYIRRIAPPFPILSNVLYLKVVS